MANPLITLHGLDKPQGVNALAAGISQGNEIARMPIQNRLLEAQAQGAEQQISKQQAEFMLRDAALDAMRGASLLEADPSGAALKDFLQNERMAKLVGRGSKDTTDTQGIIQAIDAGNLDFVRSELNAPIEAATQLGILNKGGTALKEFEGKARAAGLSPGTPEYQRAARVDLGLDPRAGSVTGQERIATDKNLTQAVAGSQATIEGEKAKAKEQGKLETQAKMLPAIRADIKTAEDAAKSRGETLSAYKKASAALPGLQEVAGKLKALADVATYTVGGKAFDEIVKQMGFGATEGATARVKMGSLVDNQILPLLRETFGAAFTAAEGDRLRATLLDVDATPEAKKASVDAFLDQKMRNLEAQERELGIEQQGSSSIEDLVNKYAD